MNRFEMLTEFLEVSPLDTFLLYAMGMEYVSRSENEMAVNYFKKVVALDPGYLGAYYQMDKYYEALADLGMAKAAFEKGIAKSAIAADLKTKAEMEQALFLLD